MASFPDNLPPEGLPLEYKFLIYFGLLYILSTAITTWLVTRRRVVTKVVEIPAEPAQIQQPTNTSNMPSQPIVGLSQALSFEDTQDRLSSMKIEVQGAEAALTKLRELQKNDQISPEAYMKLSARYNEIVNKIRADMNLMVQSDIESSSGQIDEGITQDEMEAIEADLEKQLLDLEDDDSFLKKRPKKDLDDLLDEQSGKKTPMEQPAKVAVQPPTEPSVKPKEQKRVPMPPPPKKAQQPVSQVAPPTAANNDKAAMMPPPPKKAQAPSPPGSTSKATPPRATPPATPTSNQPLSAAQPMKVEADENDSMFAKSTSIAALRMDMLRELARLKKLIPEDQDKDQ